MGLKNASTVKEHTEPDVLAGVEACIAFWNVDLEGKKDEQQLENDGSRTHDSHPFTPTRKDPTNRSNTWKAIGGVIHGGAYDARR